MAAVLILTVLVAVPLGSKTAAVPPSSVWATAQPMTFDRLETTYPNDELFDVSCPAVGECVAVGKFRTDAGRTESFAVRMTAGEWGTAQAPVFASGVHYPNTGDSLNAVDCPAVGECVAVGQFRNATGYVEAFAWVMSGGVWGTPTVMAMDAGRAASTDDSLRDVACPAVGDCVAVGYMETGTDPTFQQEAVTWMLEEGAWNEPRLATFDAGTTRSVTPYDWFLSVSCSDVGSCAAAGFYENADDQYTPMTAVMTIGSSSNAQPTTFGTGVQYSTPWDEFYDISCADITSCVAAGYVRKDASWNSEAIISTMTSGVWGTSNPITVNGARNTVLGSDQVFSVDCASPGRCVAVGKVATSSGTQSFSVSLADGTWSDALLPTFPEGSQHSSHDDVLLDIDCPSIDACVAVGYFKATSGRESFASSLVAGTWQTATPARFGSIAQHASPNDQLNAVDCSASGACVAVGKFKNAVGRYEAFAIAQRPANVELAGLSTSSGTLDPGFSAATTSYAVSTEATEIAVTPAAASDSATITVNGTAVASGQASADIPLTIGANSISIVVTDGTDTATTTITVTRTESPSTSAAPDTTSEPEVSSSVPESSSSTVPAESSSATSTTSTTTTTATTTTTTTEAHLPSNAHWIRIEPGQPTVVDLEQIGTAARLANEAAELTFDLGDGVEFLNDEVRIARSTDLSLSARGFAAGSTVEIWMLSDPVLLETTQADDDGTIALELQLASEAPIGTHSLQLRGTTSDDAALTISLWFELVDESEGSPGLLAELPATGTAGLPVPIALLLLGIGMSLRLVRRNAASGTGTNW